MKIAAPPRPVPVSTRSPSIASSRITSRQRSRWSSRNRPSPAYASPSERPRCLLDRPEARPLPFLPPRSQRRRHVADRIGELVRNRRPPRSRCTPRGARCAARSRGSARRAARRAGGRGSGGRPACPVPWVILCVSTLSLPCSAAVGAKDCLVCIDLRRFGAERWYVGPAWPAPSPGRATSGAWIT